MPDSAQPLSTQDPGLWALQPQSADHRDCSRGPQGPLPTPWQHLHGPVFVLRKRPSKAPTAMVTVTGPAWGWPWLTGRRSDIRLRDSTEEERAPGKEGEGAGREIERERATREMQERESGEQGASEAGRAQRGQRERGAPDRAPAVGASLGVLRAEGTCPLPLTGSVGRGGGRRLCGAWVRVAGFLQKSAPRVTLESCPSAPLCQGCGCWEGSENEEATLWPAPQAPPPAGRQSRDTWEVQDKAGKGGGLSSQEDLSSNPDGMLCGFRQVS